MSVSKKPTITQIGAVSKPIIPTHFKQSINWSFSFKYFRQQEHFGFSHTRSSWFTSLLERLQDLSSINKDEFDRNPVVKDKYRHHIINWNSENVPINRNDLNWIENSILSNPDEFPFYQFHLSKALGRIVGFWNSSNTIFYIVLLDPMHNIQPSDYNQKKVKECHPTPCDYTGLLNYVDEVRQSACENDKCGYRRVLQTKSPHIYPERIIIGHLNEGIYGEFEEVLKTKSFSEIIITGIVNLT